MKSGSTRMGRLRAVVNHNIWFASKKYCKFCLTLSKKRKSQPVSTWSNR
jgi:hypothetical protein